ncbi:MAG: YggT family protein [Kistimonas sp.]|nr:YggT family protein [Kistimonas sp.]
MSVLKILVDTLSTLLVTAVLLRFLLQLVRADFYNPVSQAIVKLTSPLLSPLRRLIPGFGSLDPSSLVLAFLVQGVFVFIKINIMGYMLPPAGAFTLLTLFFLLETLLDFYTFALIVLVISSWVAPGSYSPGLALLHQLTDPLCNRVRRFVPPLGGLDFSVMIVMFGIFLLKNALPGLLQVRTVGLL